MSMLIEQGGMLTTIQDGGRVGYGQFGIPRCGAMDEYSMSLANILVGNPLHTATLEITVTGPCIRFTSPTLIALAGGRFSPKLNGNNLPMYTAFMVNAGDLLEVGSGSYRTYLAVAGGFDLPKLLGSHSAYLKVDLGGAFQRGLKTGDQVPTFAPNCDFSLLHGRSITPPVHGNNELRVTLGPQRELFTSEGVRTFLDSVYTVGANDRMGYRLTGQKVEHVEDANIISDGIVPGAVQVPQDGQPIVMMADCQTTGGYAKIATVISTDLPKLAQLNSGDTLRFCEVSVEQAQAIYVQRRQELDAIAQALTISPHSHHDYRVTVNGREFEVTVRREM